MIEDNDHCPMCHRATKRTTRIARIACTALTVGIWSLFDNDPEANALCLILLLLWLFAPLDIHEQCPMHDWEE